MGRDKSKMYKNSKDEWYTPTWLIRKLEKEYSIKFTLDPCTTKEVAKEQGFKKYYTKETNGLDKSWQNEIVWLNPPFSTKDEWIDKVILELQRAILNSNRIDILLLLPASLETIAIQKLLEQSCELIIPNKRIGFSGTKSSDFTPMIYRLRSDRFVQSYEILDIRESKGEKNV